MRQRIKVGKHGTFIANGIKVNRGEIKCAEYYQEEIVPIYNINKQRIFYSLKGSLEALKFRRYQNVRMENTFDLKKEFEILGRVRGEILLPKYIFVDWGRKKEYSKVTYTDFEYIIIYLNNGKRILCHNNPYNFALTYYAALTGIDCIIKPRKKPSRYMQICMELFGDGHLDFSKFMNRHNCDKKLIKKGLPVIVENLELVKIKLIGDV